MATVDEGAELLQLDLAPNDFRGVVVDVRGRMVNRPG
jgi:hypothetical protein